MEEIRESRDYRRKKRVRDRVREAEKTSYVNKIKRRYMKSSQQG